MPHPSPPLLGQLLDIAHLVSPEGGALANLVLLRGQAFAIPWLPPPSPELLASMFLPIQHNTKRGEFHWKHKQTRRLVHMSRKGKTSLHFFIAYQARSQELSTWIDTFFLLVMEWNFCWSRIWINLAMVIFLISAMIIYHLRNFTYFYILFNYSEQITFNTAHYQWTI